MDEHLVSLVQAHIFNSLSASEYYKELSSMAPNFEMQRIIMDMSRDEAIMANQFQQLHHQLMVSGYLPIIEEVVITETFQEALLYAISNELRSYNEFARNAMDVTNEDYRRLAMQNAISKNARATSLLAMYVVL